MFSSASFPSAYAPRETKKTGTPNPKEVNWSMKHIETFTKSEVPAVEVINAKQVEELNAMAARQHQDIIATNALKRAA